MRQLTFAICCTAVLTVGTIAHAQDGLRPPLAFDNIQDRDARSRALFTEAAKVIMNPRCMNCHPAGDHPLQGNDQHVHNPPVSRGADGGGVPGNTCGACHMQENVSILVSPPVSFESIPGRVRWGLAPLTMAWEGKTMGDICRQISDPNRNGGRDLALLHDHIAKDDLVGWAWHPGPGRNPVPGTQAQLGDLIQAWVDTGAKCPP
jgi:hypothetical protein